MAVSFAQAINLMGDQLSKIDKTFANQFLTFKTNILTLEKKVKTDAGVFNSSRKQGVPPSLSGGNYYGRKYDRQVGGRLGATKYENEFAYDSGVSRYV